MPSQRRTAAARPPSTVAGRTYQVRRIILAPDKNGRRLRFPLIVDICTGFPARVAMRWAIRRLGAGVSERSVYRYCRPILHAYEWALRHPAILDLDLHLTEGYSLTKAQLNDLITWVDAGGRPALAGAIRHGVRAHVSEPAVAAVELAALQSFLEFALDPAQRKGQLARTDLSAAAETLADVFRKRTPKHTVQPRKTPGGRLNEEELAQVRRLIGSPARRPGAENPFGERVAYRNWLLFEVSIATGFRVSELAALTVSSVPRGRDLMKLRDISGAAWDPRREEAGTKTFARNIPIPQWLIEHLWEYLDNPREPWGRSQKGRNQALWTAPDGKPLSVRQTSRVFHEIGRAAGFRVTAHRPRHRFVYEVLGRMDPQTARELTGHSSSQGLRPYAEERLGEQAQEKHRAGHEAIAAFLRSGHEAGHLEES